MNLIHSTLDTLRERLAPISHTSTFRQTGQVTPEEFVLAADYLVYKFPTWSWNDASNPSKRVNYLPAGKQFLITRGVPCARRLGKLEDDRGEVDRFVADELEKGTEGGDEDGWLQTGDAVGRGLGKENEQEGMAKVGDVRTLGDGGEVGEREEEEEEIPDLEDEEDEEAIIPEGRKEDKDNPLRTYTLYITYSPYYRTPRLYLSGSFASGQPLPPHLMMEDIVGDYADKTVTLEDFPAYDTGLKMASIHPCKHASVMKVLLDRADAAMKLRLERLRAGRAQPSVGRVGAGEGEKVVGKGTVTGMEGLTEELEKAKIEEMGRKEGTKAAEKAHPDEWELLQEENNAAEEAIRVDQYLVVFLKFMASVTPGMNYDFTMGL